MSEDIHHELKNTAPSSQSGLSMSAPMPSPPDWKEIFEFIRTENEKDRSHLHRTFQIVVWACTVVMTVVLFAFFYMTNKSLDEAKQSVRSTIQARLEQEFATPQIKQTVTEAAKEATRAELSPAIRSAVEKEVSSVRSQMLPELTARLNELRPRILRPDLIQRIRKATSSVANEIRQQIDRVSEGSSEGIGILIHYQVGDSDAANYARTISEAMLAGDRTPAVNASASAEVYPRGLSFCVGGKSGEYDAALATFKSILAEGGLKPLEVKQDTKHCAPFVVLLVGSR